jgi:hypothetical protein
MGMTRANVVATVVLLVSVVAISAGGTLLGYYMGRSECQKMTHVGSDIRMAQGQAFFEIPESINLKVYAALDKESTEGETIWEGNVTVEDKILMDSIGKYIKVQLSSVSNPR